MQPKKINNKADYFSKRGIFNLFYWKFRKFSLF